MKNSKDETNANSHAGFYDDYWQRKQRRFLQVSKRLKERAFLTLSYKHAKNSTRCLDAGCGLGHLASALSKRYSVTAFDFSTHTIANNRKSNMPVDFLVRDILSQPLTEDIGTFDLVVCMDVIEHIPFDNQATVVSNLSQYLTKNGILIISTPDRNQALRYKRDSLQTDADFLRIYEGQPVADCLTEAEFDKLINRHFSIVESLHVVPTCPSRHIDLLWKSLALITTYRGVNTVTKLLQIPGRYLVKACRKNT